jgi:hypothetical protein
METGERIYHANQWSFLNIRNRIKWGIFWHGCLGLFQWRVWGTVGEVVLTLETRAMSKALNAVSKDFLFSS